MKQRFALDRLQWPSLTYHYHAVEHSPGRLYPALGLRSPPIAAGRPGGLWEEVWGKATLWGIGAGESQVFMLRSIPSAPRLGETLDERNAMLFARRGLQRWLNELRVRLGGAAVGQSLTPVVSGRH